ncbi:hypothetical protein HYQ46_008512 [Verticillium longisporum]|nr:hypothetical protein HYQ46_008512 [Verticillium longisporum]
MKKASQRCPSRSVKLRTYMPISAPWSFIVYGSLLPPAATALASRASTSSRELTAMVKSVSLDLTGESKPSWLGRRTIQQG